MKPGDLVWLVVDGGYAHAFYRFDNNNLCTEDLNHVWYRKPTERISLANPTGLVVFIAEKPHTNPGELGFWLLAIIHPEHGPLLTLCTATDKVIPHKETDQEQ